MIDINDGRLSFEECTSPDTSFAKSLYSLRRGKRANTNYSSTTSEHAFSRIFILLDVVKCCHSLRHCVNGCAQKELRFRDEVEMLQLLDLHLDLHLGSLNDESKEWM